ncbi:beta strand repeat-containing protein, partial [Streptobacillus felis]|uniref:beta strand repeat-containing protein n=2 Tax=Streptobacillus felis TaxID=1384509 RepID=UPI0039EB5B40
MKKINDLEKDLKRYLKRKVSITGAVMIAFLITGGVTFGSILSGHYRDKADTTTISIGEGDSAGDEGAANTSTTNGDGSGTRLSETGHSIAIGGSTRVQNLGWTTVLGFEAKALSGQNINNGGVSLGAFSNLGKVNSGTGTQILEGVNFKFAGGATDKTSVLSIGSGAGTSVDEPIVGSRRNGGNGNYYDYTQRSTAYQFRQIQNVAAGKISEDSTDAINGSQLFAVFKHLKENATLNNEISLGGDNSSTTNTQALNKQGGIKFNILSANAKYITTTASGDNVSIDLAQETKNKIDNAADKNLTNVSSTTVTNKVNKGSLNSSSTYITVSNGSNKLIGGDASIDLSTETKNKIDNAADKNLSNITTTGENKIKNLAAWNLQANGANQSIIKGGDTVNFINGKNISITKTGNNITVATNDDVTFNKVTTNELKSGPVTINNSGINAGNKQITNVASGGDVNTNVANISDVKKAKTEINTSGYLTKTENNATDGHKIYNLGITEGSITASENGTATAGNTQGLVTNTTVVNAINKLGDNKILLGADGNTKTSEKALNSADKIQFNVKGTNNEIVTTASGDSITIKLADKVKNDISTTKDKVDNQGISFKGDKGTAVTKKLGETLNVKGSTNIETESNAESVVIKLKDNITVSNVNTTTLTAGPISINANGLNAGNKSITNLAPGVNGTDAVNVNQLNEVRNNTFKLTGDNSSSTDVQALNKNGGLSFAIEKGSEFVTTNASGSKVTVDLSQETKNKINNAANINLSNISNDGKKVITDLIDIKGTGAAKVSSKVDSTGKKIFTVNVEPVNATSYGFNVNSDAVDGGIKNGSASTAVVDGGEVKLQAGKNIKVDQNSTTFTYSLQDNLKGITSIKNTENGPTITFSGDKINVTGGDLDLGGKKVTNIADPTNETDATNKKYVDAGRTTVTSSDKTITVQDNGTAPNKAYDIKVNVDGTTIKVGNEGKLTANTGTINNNNGSVTTNNGDGSKLTTVDTVVNAINNSGFSVVSNDGTKTLINPGEEVKFINGNATTSTVTQDGNNVTVKYDVNTDNSTIKVEGGKLKAITTTTTTTTDGKAEVTEANKNNLVTADTLVKAVNEASHKVATKKVEEEVTTSSNETGVNVKAGDKVLYQAGKNLEIKQNDKTITYGLSKSLEGITSIKNTENGPTITFTGDKINVTGGDLDLGGKKVTNVGAPTENGDVTNKQYVDAGRTTVTSSDNSIIVENKGTDPNKSYDLKVNVDGDTIVIENGKLKANIPTVEIPKGEIEKEDKGTVKAKSGDETKLTTTLEVAKAINNSGFSVVSNDGTKTLINPGEEVKFINGNATTSTVTQDGNNVTVKYDINTDGSTITINNEGKLTVDSGSILTTSNNGKKEATTPDSNKVAKTGDVVNTVNALGNNTIKLGGDNSSSTNAQTLNKENGIKFNVLGDGNINTEATGDNINVKLSKDLKGIDSIGKSTQDGDNKPKITFTNSNITVNAPISMGNKQITDLASGLGNTKLEEVTGNTLTNAVNVADLKKAIEDNKYSFKVEAAATQEGSISGTPAQKIVEKDNVVKLQAGKNLNIDQNDKVFTYSLKDDLSDLSSATFKNQDGDTTTLNSNGITINPVVKENGKKEVTLTKDGLDNGGNKITNVADGEVSDTSKEAVNGSQLNAVKKEASKHT